jgi:hypothetical protein
VESFKRERELMVAVLAALHDPARAAELPADDPLLLRVARRHRLTPLLSLTCGKTLPPKLREVARRDLVVTVRHNVLLGQVAGEVVRALQVRGVRSIILKGLEYETRLYATTGARPTTDVDILIPEAHRRTAFVALDDLGFEPRAAAPGFDDPDYHEVAWARAGVEVDLHLALAPLARCRIDYDAVWDEAVPLRLADTDALALAPPHAAVFHALHMAIEHFDVPAIYLVDLARLVPSARALHRAEEVARSWRCDAPLATALSLVNALVPGLSLPTVTRPSWPVRRIVNGYGGCHRLPRPAQLVRKVLHFDHLRDLARYTVVQSRRKLRELFERRVARRSARERLGLRRANGSPRPA